ncbi:pilus assembly FimT family protein [Acinetobacter haemolyticus]|uniref:pilus assembly FimT family protein n=1 Tax=Acinetobacter haemolyticus TaxID=29430 RepID=UPI001372C26E|nr:GspH/FimT family pseudopilin [Acinetobacter haemolyticus]NAR36066.1 prepilin-type N-terminal cleavage/methylation domain-containing protein [Acinetobacter haemolyticus]
MGKNWGFTLIELMVVIAVLAIITTMAAPAFNNMVARQQLNAATRELVFAINQAKSQAALMKTTIAVCLNRTNTDDDFDKGECATALIPGYTALAAADQQEVRNTRVISIQINPQVAIESTSAVMILFNDVGSATTTETFSFCKSAQNRTIEVTRLGNVQQVAGTC